MNTSMPSCSRRMAAGWRLRMRAAMLRCGILNLGKGCSVTQNIRARYWLEGWHPGGKFLATAGEDGVGRVWDVGSGEECAVVPVGDGKGWVEHLAWESSGERFGDDLGKNPADPEVVGVGRVLCGMGDL